MSTAAAVTKQVQGIEVTVAEMFNYQYEYEHFVDLLRDKLPLADGEYYRCVIQEYALMGVPRPNVGSFHVTYVIEAE